MRLRYFSILFLLFHYCSAGSWVQKLSLTGGQRDGAVGFSIGNKGYIGTGYNHGASYYYKDFWEYDPDSDTWTQKADFGGGFRDAGVGFSITSKGKGYIGLGLGPSGYQSDFWEWDQASNTWEKKSDFVGGARAGAVGFSIGTKGYICTGGRQAPLVNYKDLWEWESDTSPASYNTWIPKANFAGSARAGCVVFSISNKGYVGMGGTNGLVSGIVRDFWEWDQASNLWSQKADFAFAGTGVGFSINNKGYVGAIEDSLGIDRKDFWQYDPISNTWDQKVDFGGAVRSAATAFSIGSKGYLGMGFFFTVSTNDFWEYCDTCSVGIEELNNSLSAQIFPNPVTDNLSIAVNKQYDFMKAELYSISGTKVFDKEYRNIHSSFQINISEYQSGIYFLKLNDNANSVTKKIIIQ